MPIYQLKIVPIDSDEHRFAGLNYRYDFIVGPYNSEISGDVYPFYPISEYRFCLSLPRNHPLAKESILSFEDLDGERLMVMKRGNSEINDQIRFLIKQKHPNIMIEDIAPHYSINTFNQCVEKNTILLSLECWKDVHPGLISVPLCEEFDLPYGIVTAQKPMPELEEFIRILQESLAVSSDG